MGLDVQLYRFQKYDSDSILKLVAYWPSPPPGKAFADAECESGISARILSEPSIGGEAIGFTSRVHPACHFSVGDWDDFGSTSAILKRVTGRDLLYAFPEAAGDPRFLRPDWKVARSRTIELLEEFKKLAPSSLEEYANGRSMIIQEHLERLEVVVETIDFVLLQQHPREFLLLWSP